MHVLNLTRPHEICLNLLVELDGVFNVPQAYRVALVHRQGSGGGHASRLSARLALEDRVRS